MDRDAASTYLTEEYRDLATDAKFTTQQTTDAYAVAIDNSLRKLGVDEVDLSAYDVEQTNVQKYIALLNYYALKRFARLLAIRFDVKVGNGALEASRSQAFKAVMALLEEAEEELLVLGIVVGGNIDGYQMGRLTLDYLEPSWTGWF